MKRAKWQSRKLPTPILPQKHWKTSRNNQFCDNSRKQLNVYSNQMSTESRKRHFKIIGRFCSDLFVLPLPLPLLVCVRAQSCLTLLNPMDCRLPGSPVHEIFQARILEWVAISYSRGPSWLRDLTGISCVSCSETQSCSVRWILCHCTTWESHGRG